MTLKIVDRTGPTITKKDGTTTDVVKYGYSESYLLNESTLLNLYQATDVVDSECDVYIKSGEIDSSIGQHQITIAAKDLSNNETELLVKYEILADIPPVFILDSRLVNTSADSPLTREQIEQVAKAIAPEGATLVTLTNETQISNYQSNYNSSGSKYRIDYAYQDADGLPKTDYFYLQPGDTYVEEEEKSGWDKFWEGFCEFFEKLGNWFRGVFTKFKFDCFITNSEWDARFPN